MSIIVGPGRGPVTGDASPYVGGTNEPEGVCRVFYSEGTEVQPPTRLVDQRAPKGRPTRSSGGHGGIRVGGIRVGTGSWAQCQSVAQR